MRWFSAHLRIADSVLPNLGQGTNILLYATLFHFLAGIATGSVFKIQTLLFLLTIILGEGAILAAADSRSAGLWAVVNFAAIQTGYILGVIGRALLEQAGYSIPPVKLRWPQ